MGFTVERCTVDLRPGGMFLYGLRSPDGAPMWGRFVYREIEAPQRLVHVVSFSDEKGGATRHPMHLTWPLEMASTTEFADERGKTKVTVRWAPLNATVEERRTFDEGHDQMRQGLTGTFEQLEAYPAES